jgi:hypothetical protein
LARDDAGGDQRRGDADPVGVTSDPDDLFQVCVAAIDTIGVMGFGVRGMTVGVDRRVTVGMGIVHQEPRALPRRLARPPGRLPGADFREGVLLVIALPVVRLLASRLPVPLLLDANFLPAAALPRTDDPDRTGGRGRFRGG